MTNPMTAEVTPEMIARKIALHSGVGHDHNWERWLPAAEAIHAMQSASVSDGGEKGWRFEARPAGGATWEVWDVSDHNPYPAIIVDSKGASEDFHEQWAKRIAAALATEGRE